MRHKDDNPECAWNQLCDGDTVCSCPTTPIPGNTTLKINKIAEVEITSKEVWEWVRQCGSPLDIASLAVHCARSLSNDDKRLLYHGLPQQARIEANNQLKHLADSLLYPLNTK